MCGRNHENPHKIWICTHYFHKNERCRTLGNPASNLVKDGFLNISVINITHPFVIFNNYFDKKCTKICLTINRFPSFERHFSQTHRIPARWRGPKGRTSWKSRWSQSSVNGYSSHLKTWMKWLPAGLRSEAPSHPGSEIRS